MTSNTPVAPSATGLDAQQQAAVGEWIGHIAALHGLDVAVRWADCVTSEALNEKGRLVVQMSLREASDPATARHIVAHELGHLVLGHKSRRRAAGNILASIGIAAVVVIVTGLVWAVAARLLAAAGSPGLAALLLGLGAGGVVGSGVAGVLVRWWFLSNSVRGEFAADDFAQRYELLTQAMARQAEVHALAEAHWSDRAMRWLTPTHPTWAQCYARQS